MALGGEHLIVRGADLLVLGVRWSGFDVVGGGRLVARPGGRSWR